MKSKGISVFNKTIIIINSIRRKGLGEYSACCAYFTILSFIPLLLLILTLTKYIGLDKQILTLTFGNIIPSNTLKNAITEIVREVYSKSVGTITISAIVVLWAAGKGFFALCKGLSKAYDIENTNRFIYFRVRGIICTIIFIAIIIVTLIIMVFGNRINLILQEKFNIFSVLINTILKSKIFIGFLILFISFSIMYKFVPKHKYKIREQIVGASISSIFCIGVSIFYSINVDYFTGFSFMYGSLTTIVLAMMWLYACMYSILIGAVINNEIIKLKNIKLLEKSVEVKNEGRIFELIKKYTKRRNG